GYEAIRFKAKMNTIVSTIPARSATSTSTVSRPGRLISLDVFRGATIAAMILVNNPGDEVTAYWPLQHAAWNGWTPTDLIFPFFVFIVGVAMAFSFSSRQQQGQGKTKLLQHVLWRGLLILDRKSTRLNSSHEWISYAVFC